MASANLLTLIDDIATLLDDVAVMTKVAAKKTAGVLGDDLALNAQQVTGVVSERELPVVWAVAKGSALNKVILVPAALAISAFVPVAITPLLMFGGAFLCYEGFEKIVHKLSHRDDEAEHPLIDAIEAPEVDPVAFEREKVRGAIRTDFILSAEIIAITLGTVTTETLLRQFSVLTMISVLMTVGVYGFVAIIVKLDDAGLYLSQRDNGAAQRLGEAILWAAPLLMKLLGIVGTIAMFLVGGGIIAHGIPGVEGLVHDLSARAGALGVVIPTLANAVIGIITGAIALGLVMIAKRIYAKARPAQDVSAS